MILNADKGCFVNGGVNVMVFDDIYPAGHQSGIGVIMHGKRIATNGDLRFEQTPVQWQPVPKQLDRQMDTASNTVSVTLKYPDEGGNLTGLNPMIYPDIDLKYQIKVQGLEDSVIVTLDLDSEIPSLFEGKASFNIELFPGGLFGKPYLMDGKSGIFPRQVNGPVKMMPSNFRHSGHHVIDPGNLVRNLLRPA